MDSKQARYLHRMLDRLAEGKNLSPEEIALLRKELPELPKQKTLEEIAWDMDFAWAETSGNNWKAELFGDLETWLSEQHNQLRAHLEGVKSQAHPTLPAGMRIAEHEEYGRCVVSPEKDIFRRYFAFHLDNWNLARAACHYVSLDALTFIDAESAEPTHPEFLETEADYESAPEGTIVAIGDESPRMKYENVWPAYVNSIARNYDLSGTRRRILRWGWGE